MEVADASFLAPPGEVADWRMVLLFDAAAEAGLLARLPAGAAELAAATDLDAHGIAVVLDALAAWGIVEVSPNGYSTGANVPGPELAAVLRHHARALRGWSTSVPDRLRGAAVDQSGSARAQPEVFLDALGAGARRAAPGIVDLCLERLPRARRVLDLGGLHGEYSLEFARRGVGATMQDLPTMVDILEGRGVLDDSGVELFAGDFFETMPDGPFDLVLCAGITHTFDAGRNMELYGKVRRVLAPGGAIAVVTFLRRRHPMAAVFAVQMLANCRGGDTHGEEEYRAWLSAAGFGEMEVVDLHGRAQSLLMASAS
ncbi:MAG TPA: class I SAM-dependent methyltransferase [Acidimicrobiales bacterium]|nr:class I SAM-dependent methyltransferase [Acidimicrobiales bacterium]